MFQRGFPILLFDEDGGKLDLKIPQTLLHRGIGRVFSCQYYGDRKTIAVQLDCLIQLCQALVINQELVSTTSECEQV